MKRLLAPFPFSIIVAAMVVATGFAAIGLGWYGVARTLDEFKQLPYLLSGGFTGLALVGTGLAVIRIQSTRREAISEVAQLEELTVEAAHLLSSLRLSREGAE